MPFCAGLTIFQAATFKQCFNPCYGLGQEEGEISSGKQCLAQKQQRAWAKSPASHCSGRFSPLHSFFLYDRWSLEGGRRSRRHSRLPWPCTEDLLASQPFCSPEPHVVILSLPSPGQKEGDLLLNQKPTIFQSTLKRQRDTGTPRGHNVHPQAEAVCAEWPPWGAMHAALQVQ